MFDLDPLFLMERGTNNNARPFFFLPLRARCVLKKIIGLQHHTHE
jgi:hypothetical protein